MEQELQHMDILIKMQKDIQELKELFVGQQNSTTNGYADIETICRALKISKDTLRRYRKKGLIPFYKVGGKVYFKETEVKDALKQHYYGYGSKNSK